VRAIVQAILASTRVSLALNPGYAGDAKRH